MDRKVLEKVLKMTFLSLDTLINWWIKNMKSSTYIPSPNGLEFCNDVISEIKVSVILLFFIYSFFRVTPCKVYPKQQDRGESEVCHDGNNVWYDHSLAVSWNRCGLRISSVQLPAHTFKWNLTCALPFL